MCIVIYIGIKITERKQVTLGFMTGSESVEENGVSADLLFCVGLFAVCFLVKDNWRI